MISTCTHARHHERQIKAALDAGTTSIHTVSSSTDRLLMHRFYGRDFSHTRILYALFDQF
jgi:isopropylmalate/homocitrate/citramalate synthase